MSADGKPQHPNDMRAQVELSLDNVAAVLAEAGMDLSNVVVLNTHVLDVDRFLSEAAETMAQRLGETGRSSDFCWNRTSRAVVATVVICPGFVAFDLQAAYEAELHADYTAGKPDD